ncbi:MAG: hypothetical protein KatS3mg102_0231 [Planctomycetota bacterium]|nr:MAG: hypothetical protein KatS3mg102_0231 [Planctomycetota bacterium]
MDVREGTRVQQWRLVERLGVGAHGEVWRAEHVYLSRTVALKLATSDSAIAGLLREARAQFGLEHPGIVRVHDVNLSHRPAFLVRELVVGRSLRQLLRERGRLEVADAAAVLRQVVEAVGYAHARGVVHGDLKPENVLVEGAEAGGRAETWRVRITDFQVGGGPSAGQAPPGQDGLRPSLVTGGALGTVHYMAPEQERPGEQIDHRADIYAIGVLLFEMLTGILPQGRDLPSDVNPAISWWWDHIYSRCYTGRERRYGSLAELARDLEAIAGGPRWGELPSQRPGAAAVRAVASGAPVAASWAAVLGALFGEEARQGGSGEGRAAGPVLCAGPAGAGQVAGFVASGQGPGSLAPSGAGHLAPFGAGGEGWRALRSGRRAQQPAGPAAGRSAGSRPSRRASRALGAALVLGAVASPLAVAAWLVLSRQGLGVRWDGLELPPLERAAGAAGWLAHDGRPDGVYRSGRFRMVLATDAVSGERLVRVYRRGEREPLATYRLPAPREGSGAAGTRRACW